MKIKLKAAVTLGDASKGAAKEYEAGQVVDVYKKLATQLIAADAAEADGKAEKAVSAAAPAAETAPAPALAPAPAQ